VRLPLAVVGVGLVSPLGVGAECHAMLMRAGEGAATPGGFATEAGEHAPVFACPWLGADLPLPDRILELGSAAARLALAPLEAAAGGRERSWVAVVGPAGDAAAPLSRALGARSVSAGSAAVFAELVRASEAIVRGEVDSAVVVGVDSLVDLSLLSAHAAVTHDPWGANLLDASEGAAAFALVSLERARTLGLEVWALVRGAAAHEGKGSDNDDEPADGVALTEVLREANAEGRPIRAAFGPTRVDLLRRRDWDLAQARTAGMFDDPQLFVGCPERDVGHVGEASGALSLGLLLACARHGALPDATAPAIPAGSACLAWGLSANGLRGAALVVPQPTSRAPCPRQAAHALGVLVSRPVVELAAVRSFDRPADASLEEDDASEGSGALVLDPRLPRGGAASISVVRAVGEGEAVSLAVWRAGVLASVLDRLAMLLRHRFERPLAEVMPAEPLLCAQLDALACLGATGDDLLAWVDEQGIEDAYLPAAAALALGSLEPPPREADDRLALLVELAETLPPSDEHIVALGRGAALAPWVQSGALARELAHSKSPSARAAGLELAGHLEATGRGESAVGPGLLVERFRHAESVEARAAARALARGRPTPAVLSALRGAFDRASLAPVDAADTPADPALAWEAARALLVLGDASPLAALRCDASLRRRLGEVSVRLLALGGALDDAPLIDALLATLDPTPLVLAGVARFGHPGSWAFLAHYLDDDDRADVADDALTLLFGPLPEAPRRDSRSEAWAAAIAELGLPEGVRVRAGRPWSAALVVRSIEDGVPSLDEAGLLVAELGCHSTVPPARLAALLA
jgi:hypothetical protein